MARREDYERTNAREWDMNARERNAANGSSFNQDAPASDGWQTVRGKKPEKPKHNREPSKGKQRAQPTQNKENVQPVRNKQPASSAQSNANISPKKQNWTNAKGKLIDAKARQPTPNLLIDVSNDAEHAWREREPPKDTVRIPHELAVSLDYHTKIAHEKGAFIDGDEAQSRSGSILFRIWGDDKAVAATKRAIEAWNNEWKDATATKSNRSAKFAKVVSLTDKQKERKENQWKAEVRKQKFRQQPPPGSIFEAIGTFHWPAQEYRPEEILGLSYEALDPIRMDCECYVIYKKELSAFEVSGKAKNVQIGLLRLRKTCFQIGARGMAPVRMYMLHWPNASALPGHVVLKAYEPTKALSDDEPTTVGNMPCGEGEVDEETQLEEQTATSERQVRISVMQALKKLHYYRGSIQLRIRLGTFLAVQFRKPKDDRYELEEYGVMIKESQFIGQVTEELGDRRKESAALDAIQCSTGLLQPGDHFSESLAAVRPIYSVAFIFADEAGDLRLSISWKETKDEGAKESSFERISKKWTRLERDTNAAVPLLDISLCDLHTGMAWQFDILASQSVDEGRLSRDLKKFEDNIQIDGNAAVKQSPGPGNKAFVKYKPFAVKLKHMRESLSYQYDILTKQGCLTDYTLDLTRFQDRAFAVEQRLLEPRWSLNVLRSDWNVFAQNENLKIGEKADWKDDIDTWFPEDPRKGRDDSKGGAGFEDLMENLKRIATLIRDVEQHDLLGDVAGGMTVG